MRTLLCAALVVAACAPGDKAGTATAGGPGQKFVGVFEGRSYRQVADTGIPWRSVMTIAPDGALRGTLTFTSITADRSRSGCGTSRAPSSCRSWVRITAPR